MMYRRLPLGLRLIDGTGLLPWHVARCETEMLTVAEYYVAIADIEISIFERGKYELRIYRSKLMCHYC